MRAGPVLVPASKLASFVKFGGLIGSRGLSKEVAKVDLWVKDLAPSTELRRWFHSDAGSWGEFQKRYRKELSANREVATDLRKQLGRKKTTFLFAVKDSRHNHAILLKAFLEKLP